MMKAAPDCTCVEDDVAKDGHAGPSNSPPVPADQARTPSFLKVLIVDDSEIVRERLAAQVSEVPFVQLVGQAAEGLTALRLFQSGHPDVVVLDIELPGMTGFEILTQIKRQRPSCIVVMLSSYASGPFRLGCDRLGADFFFSKANEFERINDVLKAILSARNPCR